MAELSDWRAALGLLSVAMAIGAAAIYVAQTLRGAVRPHPLSWFLFGVLRAQAPGCSSTRAPAQEAGRSWR